MLKIASTGQKIGAGSLLKGLLYHYPLSQSNLKSSDTFYNKCPIKNDVVSTNTPSFTTDRKGQANSAITLNGTSDNYAPDIALANTSPNPFTIACWLKVTDKPPYVTHLIGVDSGAGNSRFYVNVNSDYVYFYNTLGIQTAWPGAGLEYDTWHHVVVRCAGIGTDDWQCFVDGEGLATKTQAVTAFNFDTLFDWGTVNNNFKGDFGDLKMWDRALTDDEISLLYNSYKPKLKGSSLLKGLVGHWRLSQDNLIATDTFKDRTPHGVDVSRNTGTQTFTTDSKGHSNGAVDFSTLLYNYTNSCTHLKADATHDMTIVTRLRWDSASGVGAWFSRRDGSGVNYQGYVYGNTFWFYDGAPHNTGYSVPTGEWVTVAYVIKSAVDLDIYINGEKVVSDATINVSDYDGAWNIGTRYDGVTTFDGQMEEMRAYNRQLTDEEHQLLHDSYKV